MFPTISRVICNANPVSCVNLQAFTPVAILLISWTFRIQDPSKRLAVIIFMISMGVALASHGELRFNLIGFLTQAAAVGVSPHALVRGRKR